MTVGNRVYALDYDPKAKKCFLVRLYYDGKPEFVVGRFASLANAERRAALLNKYAEMSGDSVYGRLANTRNGS